MKFPFLISFRKALGVVMKQNSCRYYISSVFVFSLVIIAWDLCINVIEMGMYHDPSELFPCPLKISLESLRILI